MFLVQKTPRQFLVREKIMFWWFWLKTGITSFLKNDKENCVRQGGTKPFLSPKLMNKCSISGFLKRLELDTWPWEVFLDGSKSRKIILNDEFVRKQPNFYLTILLVKVIWLNKLVKSKQTLWFDGKNSLTRLSFVLCTQIREVSVNSFVLIKQKASF